MNCAVTFGQIACSHTAVQVHSQASENTALRSRGVSYGMFQAAPLFTAEATQASWRASAVRIDYEGDVSI
jgi:hypothetical protein